MGVIKTEYRFNSRVDGLSISAFSIEPENKEDVKGIVQLVHGMIEYKERYEDFMTFLAENGYYCAIHDHRGHGKSVKYDDDLGFMYEGGYKGLIEDTYQHTMMIKENVANLTGSGIVAAGGESQEVGLAQGNRRLPFILFGHSMGSLVVRSYIKKYDDKIDKLIVSGCPSPRAGAQAGLVFIDVLKAIKGGHSKSKFVDNLVMDSRYEKRFKSEKLKNSWLNTDKEAVRRYNADKYCTYSFTLNGYDNLVRLTLETYSPKGYELKNKELPIRFFSGADDPCGVSEADLENAVNIIRNAGYADVSKTIYAGMRHEILNEPEHQKVYEDMLAFINQ